MIREMLLSTDGIADALTKGDAAKIYSLPATRIGDMVVIAEKDTVFGKNKESHDLSQLKGPLRSHGGLTETTVPFIINGTVNKDNQRRSIKNWQLFDYLINYYSVT